MNTKKLLRPPLTALVGAAVAMVASAVLWAADPPGTPWTIDHPKVREVIAVQNDVTAAAMAFEEILGTAVGEGPNGEAALVIYADQDRPGVADIVAAIPPRLRGVAVMIHLTDKFRALKGGGNGGGGSGGGGISHTAKQTPPIQLGTSGGWRDDLANGYCCGGTLGALVQVGKAQYILSNYHVFEADIVAGGNGIAATDGDYIVQPGLIDVGCNANNAQNVATLLTLGSLPGSNVDVSVAQAQPGMVSSAILEIGTISSKTVGAALKQAVKKSGRTTGLTRSAVSGLNATISVAYDNECAGGPAFTKTFTGQIVITNRGSKFLNSGDSGSLTVEDVAASPRAVGLLYAGSSTSAIANPIDEVLTFVGDKLRGPATMVGNGSP